MKLIDINISRDCSLIMRGLAIIFIALHNRCHLIGGITRENEFLFLRKNVNEILDINTLSIKTICDLLSFFGWYGVTVFMFLSGYGLVKKYEQTPTIDAHFSAKHFICSNYKKLFLLMLPGTILFLMYNEAVYLCFNSLTWQQILSPLATQTLLSNLTYPAIQPSPGVYWYFGLTMQLYIIYLLLFKGKRNYWLLVVAALCIAAQFMVWDTQWMRHNCIGWIFVFAIGIWYSRHRYFNKWLFYALLALAVLSFIPATMNIYSWQWSIIAAVGVFMVLAKVSNRIPGWRNCWIYIGKMSPYIFASHPLLRSITYMLMHGLDLSLAVTLCIYFPSLFIFAEIYKYLWKLTCNLFSSKTKSGT